MKLKNVNKRLDVVLDYIMKRKTTSQQEQINKFRNYYNNKSLHGRISYIPPAKRYNKGTLTS